MCPYSLFCYVYRPKGGILYMSKSVTSLFLRGKAKASNLSYVALFAKSFEFSSERWASFYAEKARLQSQGAWPEISFKNVGLKFKDEDLKTIGLKFENEGVERFSSATFFRRGKDDLVREKMVGDPNFGVSVKEPKTDALFESVNWPNVDLKPAVLHISKALQEENASNLSTYNNMSPFKETIVNSNIIEGSTQSLEHCFDYDIGDWHGMSIGAQICMLRITD